MRFNRARFGHRPGPQWAFHALGPAEIDRVAFEGGALLFYSDRLLAGLGSTARTS